MGEAAMKLEADELVKPEPPAHRDVPKLSPCLRCAICAKQDLTREVVVLPSGVPTGLCRWHTAFEADLRAELRAMAKSKTLTREDQELARQNVTNRSLFPE
jgi:hypothetical protein